jgi:hypothetical protein
VTVQTYVFAAELVGSSGVTRTISVRGDLTLVDLHYALQAAFDWDDDHLYSFWLDDSFWAPGADRYMHPCRAPYPSRPSSPLRSAQSRLDELGLVAEQRLAYVFDFVSEWRVRLRLREIVQDDGSPSPRLLLSAGVAPPQYGAIRAHRRVRAHASAEGANT